MKRDIFKYAEAGHKKLGKAQAYDLSTQELQNIVAYEMEHAQKSDSGLTGVYEAVYQAYAAGFEAGTRYEKNRQK